MSVLTMLYHDTCVSSAKYQYYLHVHAMQIS